MGARCPAWADIKGLSPDSAEDEPVSTPSPPLWGSSFEIPLGSRLIRHATSYSLLAQGAMETVSYVKSLIASEVSAGIPPERIVVGGFSQGAAMSYLTALTHDTPLGGCVILSGWLMMREK